MKYKSKFLLAAMVISMAPLTQLTAQLAVSSNKTAPQLANALVGSGVTVSNATLTCASGANGTFSGATSPLSISEGILLTTGSAAATVNPASFFSSEATNTPGDANLTALAGQPTLDACILEFDFVAQGDAIKFDYQFGSEEYPDFSCQVYNDAFGFFLSGPGYAVPTNIAVLPTTNTAVTINTTTGFGTCNPVHPYFINNVNGPAPAYDGLTSVLSAEANITMGATYHLKLGIADAADRIYSSGVFLEQGSLTVAPPVISGCPDDITTCDPVVSWTEPTATSGNLPVTSSSTHSPGDVFPAGTTTVTYTFDNGFSQSTCSFDVTVLTSGLTITAETTDVSCYGGNDGAIDITVSNGTAPYTYAWSNSSTDEDQTGLSAGTYSVVATDANGCEVDASYTISEPSSAVSASIAVNPNPTVAGQQMNTIFLGYGPQCVTLTASGSGGTSPYSYGWSNTSSTSNSQSVCPTTTTTYTATVTDDNDCVATASQMIKVKDIRDGSKKVFICHNGNTISVSVNAVPAHLAHGDMLGSCNSYAKMAQSGNAIEDVLFKVYPNPTSGLFSIDIPETGDVTINVTDIAGKKVLEQTIRDNENHHLDIDLGAAANGLYIIKVICADNVYQSNITKQ